MFGRRFVSLIIVLVLVLSLGSIAFAQDAPSGDLEIFSWWVGGGEAAGLDALIAEFSTMYPDVTVINSAVAGGSGVNARAVLQTRLLAGEPPGTFQVHAGEELNAVWVAAEAMEPLNALYEENGWMEQYPQGLLDLISSEGNIYSVPVNIHRSNVMWFVPEKLAEWGVEVPATWDDFLTTTCPALQEAGVVPLAVGENWTQVHLWESVASGVLGSEAYLGLWTGETAWDSPEMQTVFETYGQILDCTNDDRNGLTWQDASKLVVDGAAAFNIMGDWAAGYFLVDLALEPRVGFDWVASPGTADSFMMLSDSFGLPKGAPNPEAVMAWLAFLGSAEAQDIFNPLKGSLPANTAADIGNTELYNEYFQSAYADWTGLTITGSLAHGAVGAPDFLNGFGEVVAAFGSDKDVATAVATVALLAQETGTGQ
jgi:glucose/mannose transport system substrate-binding protein